MSVGMLFQAEGMEVQSSQGGNMLGNFKKLQEDRG